MKKFLLNIFTPDPWKSLSCLMLLMAGMLIIAKGRIGIQATPEGEVYWIEVFSELDLWLGWLMIWLSLDTILTDNKATTFIISKTIVPVVEVMLRDIVGEEKLNALKSKLEKKVDAYSKRKEVDAMADNTEEEDREWQS